MLSINSLLKLRVRFHYASGHLHIHDMLSELYHISKITGKKLLQRDCA